jgi:hypothetical protein
LRLALQNGRKKLEGKREELEALQAEFVAETHQSVALADAWERLISGSDE